MRFWQTSDWANLKSLIKKHERVLTPSPECIFRPLALTKSPKIVMIFPEAYIVKGTADGLALSFNHRGALDAANTPLLFWSISKKLQQEKGFALRKGDLSHWAHRGVLLWNARPTSIIGMSGAHKDQGWEKLTEEIIETAYLNDPRCVFVFFGETRTYSDILPDDAKVVLSDMPGVVDFRLPFWKEPLFEKIDAHLKGTKRKMNWRV